MQAGQDLDLATNDLGPLAWVLDELRKSLDSASAALRRFVRDTALARGTDMAGVDGGQLRIARQQLHQAVGALEMVGLGAPAHMLRAMEAAVQKFVEQPQMCNEQAAAKVERAGFALTEYLEAVLLGKAASSVALFPQFRDVQELAGADRVHPADLWSLEWRWIDAPTPAATKAMVYDPAVRSRLDQSVLKLVKSGDADAARELAEVSLALASTQTARQPKIFWKICAAYFEAVGSQLLPLDIYVKRAGSRILLQYASLAKGDMGVSDRLAQDLVFFCSQAVPTDASRTPSLAAVREAWALARFTPVDYQTQQYGRFDPVLLAQARKRIVAAKETWSSLSGGDAGKLKTVADQFHHVSDSLSKLYPDSAPLAQALNSVIEAVVRTGRAPSPEIAMEVATAVLYLEASFEDIDSSDSHLAERTSKLAQRLDQIRQGGRPEPLEHWMEELYRRVSDRQTMGSVVGELRGTLGELEKHLDQYFRDLADKGPLTDVPGQLAQMRGVLSVLGLDQAANAVQRMREAVEEIIVTDIDEEKARAAGTFEKLGNNLGALGFLIDMLNYQPALAKKLFVYDEATGELRPLMGRVAHPQEEAADSGMASLTEQVDAAASGMAALESSQNISDKLDRIAAQAVLAEKPAIANTVREAAAAVAQDPSAAPALLTQLAAAVKPPPAVVAPPAEPDIEEDELLGIFLEEAREVVGNGLAAIDALGANPGDVAELTTLRRAFHTLKGSSRMVGLNEFGEAGWALEQVLNTWLADQKPAQDDLRTLAREAMQGFARWVEDIANHRADAWKSAMFRGPADIMRMENRLVPIALPEIETIEVIEAAPMLELPAEAEAAFDFDLDLPSPAEPQPEPAAVAAVAVADADAIDISFDIPEAPVEEIVLDAAPVAENELPADFEFSPEPALADEAENIPAPVPEAVEIEGIDFASLSAVSGAPEAQDEPVHPIAVEAEDPVKVIGPLRIGIPLYNVYLNEADEWSRRLANELAEWALELHQPVPDSPVGLAHALAGSSATVGFNTLSDIARALESSLEHTQRLAWATPQHGKAFNDAADEIRRLLHQFAAGFLKDPNPAILVELEALKSLEIPQRAEAPDTGADQDFEDFEFEMPPAPVELQEPQPPVAQAPVEQAPEPAAPPPPPPTVSVPVMQAIAQPAPLQVVPRPAVRVEHTDDEDIDIADAVDADLFPIFEDEANELMPQLGGALRQWSARPDNRSARDEVLRALHTLKGSARLAGALRLGELAHRMESHVESISPEGAVAGDIDPLLQRFDVMQASFDTLRAQVSAGEQAALDDIASASVAAPRAEAAEAAPATDATEPGALAPQRALIARPAAMQLSQRALSGQAVRVRSDLLDRLMNQAGEVMITRSRLEQELGQLRSALTDLTGNLDRLRSQLRDIELQAETQMASRLAQAQESGASFDPLEFDRFTRVQELTRMMAESVNDVATVQRSIQRTVEATEDDLVAQARQTRELQRDLLRTRMVEFEGISDRLYRVVRLASKETGKQVKLDITGGSIEMDRGVLDRMTPAFEHLLRNCVAHGIEAPALRAAGGKDASGNILVNVQQEGNDVSVEFRDDGAGLDLARIRDKAREQGLIAANHDVSDAEAAQLIFMPGFSTATQVTELAGRGIGMDVVRAEVNALGGRIETATTAGHGASFKLVLPLTTAVTQVVMIRAGNLSFGVPANLVEIVRRATGREVEQAYNGGSFEFAGEQLPFFWCGSLLQASTRSTEPVGKTLPVVIFRSAAQRIAVHVDEVLGNQEVVVKNLGPQLARLPGLAGMTLLASGAVVLIYNPVALSTVYGDQARKLSADHAQPDMLEQHGAKPEVPLAPAAPQIPLVLVVDDSITVRRVTQRLLQREGYRVALAADGLQALERLAEERPTVVLSDIEMPRMDGFDLARNIRADARTRDLPIVMITSRIAEKHREHAKELGVDHYLGKPYSEEELLSLVKHYSAQAVMA